MNKKIIIIEGFLASGKSTFAELLAKSLSVPCFIKDQMKIALCKSVSVTNREESSRFSAVTFDAMLYSAERLMEAGIPVILEGNFVPAGVKKVDEAGVIKTLVDRYGYQSLTFHFTGDTEVLHGRFVERENQPQRGDVNRMGFTPTPEPILDAWDIMTVIIMLIGTILLFVLDFTKRKNQLNAVAAV